MAEHPWRCSNCGTINEPVANSCRTCGKWPSLFDLEDSALDADDVDFEQVHQHSPERAPELASTPAPVQPQEAPEPMTVEVETYEPYAEPEPAPRRRRFEPPPTEPVLEGEEQSGRRWVSWLVPLAFVVYLVISYAFSGR
jgi:hypothetical protein